MHSNSITKLMSKQVLDKGFVTLVDYMGSDLSAVNAARVSFGKTSALELQCKTCYTPHEEGSLFCVECGGTETNHGMSLRDKKLLKYLVTHNHTSPFRHATLTFHIKAPIFVFRQWMKHRIASEFNEISGRYVDLTDAEYFIPEVFRQQSTDNKQGSEGKINQQELANKIYMDAINTCAYKYIQLIQLGVAKEQARCVLPLSLYSEVYWTVSLQALSHFLTLRLDSHAQAEIQEYAKAVLEIAKQIYPVSLDYLMTNGERSSA